MSMRDLFLENAAVVLSAVSDQRVADAWNEPSVLEGQTVGSLVGHLGRGAVWVVGDYLEVDAPERPVDFETAAEYFAVVASLLTDEDHAAIRERGAVVAADGHAHIVARLSSGLDELQHLLPGEPRDRLVSVYASRVMRLDDYLETRLVEQVVHLDDLARSLRIGPWTIAPGAEALVVGCGAEIGRLRHGGAMIRTLFRGEGGTLPVL